MEVWIIGQPDAFTLEAKSKKSKDDFACELRKVIAKERGNTKERSGQLSKMVKNVISNETLSATSGSDSSRPGLHRTMFSRARSLDGDSWSRTVFSQRFFEGLESFIFKRGHNLKPMSYVIKSIYLQ